MSLGHGAGVLLTTEIEFAELGTHAGHTLRGRVERRLLRVALGGGERVLQLRFGRARAVAVDVEEASGRRYELPIETPSDPWLAAGRRVLLAWLLSSLALGLVARTRRRAAHASAAA